MFFVQIAVSLGLCLLLCTGSAFTAQSEMAALISARNLQFYTQDVPTLNLALQKLVAKAASFNIYSSGNLNNATLGSSTGLTPMGGSIVRLDYNSSPSTPTSYPVGFLYSQANDGLYFYMDTASKLGGPTTYNAATPPTSGSCWKIAGWANNSYAASSTAPPANSPPFNCFFSISDPFDSSGTAAGLLVISLMENNRSVTLYAERF